MSNFIDRLKFLKSEIGEETWEIESYDTQGITGDYEGVAKIKASGEKGRDIANLSEWALDNSGGDVDFDAEIITLLFNKGLPALSQLREILRPAIEAAQAREKADLSLQRLSFQKNDKVLLRAGEVLGVE